MKRLFIVCLGVCLGGLALASCRAAAPAPSIDAFFDTFTADWVRMNPNQAIATRYFTGAEQDALETQITPLTREWRSRRVELARRGLMELAAFDREQLTETRRAVRRQGFPHAVLSMGTAPLTMIEQQVNRYIADTR
jgi:uncharacterized protein (DUF885 family)